MSLALARSDYPKGARIVAVPATNMAADRYLSPVHRSSFERLRRLDGAGWLQFATSLFKTGGTSSAQRHQTVYGYAINLFPTARDAARAIHDIKLATRPSRVAHLSALIFQSSDVHRSLTFVFFQLRSVEVEAYYEYSGVAPAVIARMLRHDFSRQLSHLAHLVRLLLRARAATATIVADTPTAIPSPTLMQAATSTPTVTPAATATVTVLPMVTPSPAATSTATSTPTATATATPIEYTVQASMASRTYAPGNAATVNVHVTAGGQAQSGVLIHANFSFPNGGEDCDAQTDVNGNASCSVVVPTVPAGTDVQVTVEAVGVGGATGYGSTDFRVS